MSARCPRCGSENTHRSRVRSGERTAGMLFHKPIRCRDCNERFWVTNPGAYLTAGMALTVGGLFMGMIWLLVSTNLGDEYIAPETVSAPPSPTPEAATPRRDAAVNGNPASRDAPSTTDAKLSADRTATQTLANDHQYRVRFYLDNAKKGDSDAQYKLGLLYLTGNGALQDFAEAARWLEMSAEQGYVLAQYELGMVYRTGHGFPIDLVKSYMWLNLAAAAGIQQAIAARDEVMKSLNPRQLAEAQKTSREWLAARTQPRPESGNAISATDAAVPEGHAQDSPAGAAGSAGIP